MVKLEEIDSLFLQKPSKDDTSSELLVERSSSSYHPLHTFALPKERPYKQQFADIYFLRLTKIKPHVEAIAERSWADIEIGGGSARKVERVLDVRQGELCWVAGTVYMDMPAKPNILEDVSRDQWVSAPTTVDRYYTGSGTDSVMLEDDSGRIRLTGPVLEDTFIVTGCIIAVMGTENVNGDFEVIDIKFADLPPQPQRFALTKEDVPMGGTDSNSKTGGKKIAIVSGLEFSGHDTSYAMELHLLLEFLLGESLDPATQESIAQISRLVIAGNSINNELREPAAGVDETYTNSTNRHKKKTLAHKKYGYDSASYNPLPAQLFDEFLSELLPTMPVTILPGTTDPANASYPQQPIHPAMFPRSRVYTAMPGTKTGGWLDNVTNPWEGEVEGWRVLGTGGQNLDDIMKYVDSEDRLGVMEAMCRWRCSAPTAPDTLWAYPFQEDEPFVMKECPHLYFVGCQPEFGTETITGPDGQAVRLIAVPSFVHTREVVLVDTETLDVTKVKIVA
ncbi:DNA polymerase alpha/epsilon subunit B-domain-containing protein [Diplogelasinospora grovesii]|uniref:DNA-directed DNA polymerase n=1 Tax=Diplogelasinospora grovesii TaxID=303347 RepID=A0AAN6NIA8_9PEZI|nr:DNA polymerase alpha/epsilon subunit B-domain-containing protein [Diplogelasinospora grovesii]